MPQNFLQNIIPNYNQNSGSASDVISNLLTGNPNTATSQIAGATFGAQNGLGTGSGLSNHLSYDLYGQQAGARKQQGVQDLLSFISGISSPTLQNQDQQFENTHFNQNLGFQQNQAATAQGNYLKDFNESQRRFNLGLPKPDAPPTLTTATGQQYGLNGELPYGIAENS